jgi:glycosyltransferase involved in cell wall biosynthesis
MSRLRLVVVSRRFWPLVGGAEKAMAGLATELASRSIGVTLLTARWEPAWPAEITYRGVPVLRLTQPQGRGWGTLRYMQAVGRWLRGHAAEFDLVYVSMLKHSAYAALRAVGGRVPVVLRAEGGGASGDCRWQEQARCGRTIRRRCRQAEAIIAPSRGVERELLGAGYAEAQVRYVPNGVPIPPPRSEDRRAEARAALGAANLALRMPHDSPVAVFTGRLDPAKGLAELLSAWRRVLARWPTARLWLAGEGPMRPQLEAEIASAGLAGRVVLAGVFDNVDTLLAAADLFVLPSWEEGMSLALLEAMAAGLPIVASDIPGNRDLITPDQSGLLVPVRNTDRLASAIVQLLESRPRGARLGDAAREIAAQRFSLAQMAEAHLALFERLTGRGSGG